MTLFVDTGMWYAAMDRGDTHHGRAIEILGAGERLVTSDYVLLESWRLAAHRLGFDVAETFWDRIRRGAARLESILPVDREAAWAIGRRFSDQHFSLVDRSSFALMERMGLRRAAAFDRDFAIYRGGAHNSEAFDIVR